MAIIRIQFEYNHTEIYFSKNFEFLVFHLNSKDTMC